MAHDMSICVQPPNVLFAFIFPYVQLMIFKILIHWKGLLLLSTTGFYTSSSNTEYMKLE